MKKFSFLALIATVLCLFGCGPKETQTPLGTSGEYVLYSLSDAPDKVGIKKANGVPITPNVYKKISYEQNLFIAHLDDKCLLLTPENKVALQSSSTISYNKDAKCFETKENQKVTLYFPNEKSKIMGNFESYVPDHNGNILVKENGKYGVYAQTGKLLIPISNEMLLTNEEQYIALNSKNAKLPMLKNGKITNWSRVKITAFDKDGKEAKAPSLAQVKKLVK